MIDIVRKRECVYPAISISDSVIEDIQITDKTIAFGFDKWGYWVRNHESENYHRVSNAQLLLFECDLDSIDVFLVEMTGVLFKRKYVERVIDFNTFMDNINNKKWKFEVIQEYKSDVGGMFFGCVREMGRRYCRCYLEVLYKQYGYQYSDESIAK